MAARSGLKRYFSRGVAAARLLAAVGVVGAVISSGCGEVTSTPVDSGTTSTGTATPASSSKEPIDLTKVIWVHGGGEDIASWPVTASLEKVEIVMPNVCSTGMSWPGNWTSVGPKGVNANHVVLANIGGQWYGGAWEAMNPGIASCREMETITHKESYKFGPFGQVEQTPFWHWYPKKGEKIGFMVTSWIRSGVTQPVGRSHVVMTEWPYDEPRSPY